MTASPTTDLLGITQAFLNSPYRRLPIVEHGRLLGQISRRDLLQAAANFMTPIKQRRRNEPLYLSQLAASAPPIVWLEQSRSFVIISSSASTTC